jgi:glyoxylase-like metal-dependent hydrolase (beta-lactamase superfamily II)
LAPIGGPKFDCDKKSDLNQAHSSSIDRKGHAQQSCRVLQRGTPVTRPLAKRVVRSFEEVMADEIPYDRKFDAVAGKAETVAQGVRRILAPNPGPFTFTGTCTYIVGRGTVAVVDPGPDDDAHIAAILEAVRGETVRHIVVTHTHRDHSTGARLLQKSTGAKTFGEGPHRASRPLHEGETSRIEAGADRDFVPDERLRDGDLVEGPDYALEAITTPGHAANHLVFALKGQDCLFSGDHVMAWSTPIVAPPDGSMGDYMQSLEKLRGRPESVYLPGHGPIARDGRTLVDRYIDHRAAREAAILRRLERGESDIPGLVQAIYIGLDPRLAGAAGLTVLAHLEHLVSRGLVVANGPATISARYRPAP